MVAPPGPWTIFSISHDNVAALVRYAVRQFQLFYAFVQIGLCINR